MELLPDEMGLGKTILMVGCVRHNFKQRTLVVLPPALLSQWVAVFQRFLGHVPFVLLKAEQEKETKKLSS